MVLNIEKFYELIDIFVYIRKKKFDHSQLTGVWWFCTSQQRFEIRLRLKIQSHGRLSVPNLFVLVPP